jgi:hypothetical protein
LEPDGEGMLAEGFAIDDSRSSSEITRQGPQVQPFVQLPGIGRNDPRAVIADILGQGLLCWMADVETTEIDSYGEGNAILPPVRDGLHETHPKVLRKMAGGVVGGNDRDIIRLWEPDLAKTYPRRRQTQNAVNLHI